MPKWNISFLDCPSHDCPKSHHRWGLLQQLSAVWGLRKQLIRNCRVTGDEAMLFVIIITNPLRKQNNVWVGCTERLKFHPALVLNSFDSNCWCWEAWKTPKICPLADPSPAEHPPSPWRGCPHRKQIILPQTNPSFPSSPSLFPAWLCAILPYCVTLSYQVLAWHKAA